MRRILVGIIAIIAAVISAKANDGVFYASGNTLIPLQETRISLRKELLKFYVVDHGYARVDVDFEFFNPAGDKTLTVGFVTPPAEGDVSDEESNHPFITEFTVNVNGTDVPFKVKKLSQTSFKLGAAAVTGSDFVYFFQVKFKRGLNKIRHTYRFRGGASVELQRDFDYQITTGKRWANRRIDDFELQLHLDNGIFAVVDSFQKTRISAKWEIVGDGVFGTKRQWFDPKAPRVRMVHLNNGYLRFKAKNFSPDNDLFFAEYNWPAGWTNAWCGAGKKCDGPDQLERAARFFNLAPWYEPSDEDFSELTANDIRIVRNYFYAVRGLPFRDPELRRFYAQFFWYKPIEGLSPAEVKLTESEDKFLKKLAAFEAKGKS